MTNSPTIHRQMAIRYTGQDVIVVELDTQLCLKTDKKAIKTLTRLARKYDISFDLTHRFDIDYIPVNSLKPGMNPKAILAEFQAPELAMYITADFVHVTDESNIKSIA